jgi:hypothetical protein
MRRAGARAMPHPASRAAQHSWNAGRASMADATRPAVRGENHERRRALADDCVHAGSVECASTSSSVEGPIGWKQQPLLNGHWAYRCGSFSLSSYPTSLPAPTSRSVQQGRVFGQVSSRGNGISWGGIIAPTETEISKILSYYRFASTLVAALHRNRLSCICGEDSAFLQGIHHDPTRKSATLERTTNIAPRRRDQSSQTGLSGAGYPAIGTNPPNQERII